MAQNKYTLSSAFVPVAVGPGEVIFQFDSEPGEFAKISSVDPSGIVGGNKRGREDPVSIQLLTGEYLHLRGRGAAYVTAPTLV